MTTVYIGAGAGFAGDRTDAAGPVVAALARCDGPRFLIFETLAERTLAQAQVERRRKPGGGFNPALASFITPILRECLDSGVRIVSNFGAANPRAAGQMIVAIAADLGCRTPKVAIVEGDDLSGVLAPDEFARREVGGTLLSKAPPIVAANAYVGAAPIAEALDRGAEDRKSVV